MPACTPGLVILASPGAKCPESQLLDARRSSQWHSSLRVPLIGLHLTRASAPRKSFTALVVSPERKKVLGGHWRKSRTAASSDGKVVALPSRTQTK